MASLSEYFSKNRYQPKYFLGERIRGIHQGIPFSGTVANDSKPYENSPPRVSVFLDLPIKIGDVYLNILAVAHNEILKDDVNGKSRSKVASRKSKTTNKRNKSNT